MIRTKRLMRAVTASLILTGELPAIGSLSMAIAQTVPKENEDWKTDPKIGETAEQIFGWLKDVPSGMAKSKDEIQKKFPELSSAITDDALKRLLYEGSIKQLGDGSKDKPYLYYGRDSHTG